jgi:outer membrane protein insertion porin family
VLSSSPVSERIGIVVQVDEGQQYLLGGIRFRNNRAISNEEFLRDMFPLQDGEIFSRKEIAKGLDNLRFAYGQLGYINFTAIPNTQINEENQTISLEVEVDEGRQFSVSNMRILGRDDQVLHDSLLQPGDIYNQRLVNLFFQKHAPPSVSHITPDSRVDLKLDERAATVAITFDFRDCAVE